MEIQEKNYHHAVFICLNPRGEIAPGLTAQTEWIFSPLEAKTYTVSVSSLGMRENLWELGMYPTVFLDLHFFDYCHVAEV